MTGWRLGTLGRAAPIAKAVSRTAEPDDIQRDDLCAVRRIWPR